MTKTLISVPQPSFRIHELVSQHLPHAAGRTAIVDGARAWTYQQLWDDAQILRQQLAQAGLQAGDRLMIVGENGAAQVLALLAASLSDAWAAVVNARLTQAELTQIEQHCRPRLVLYTTDVSEDALAHAQRRDLKGQEVNGLSYHCTHADEAVEAEPIHADSAQQVAVLIYTSGSTGTPTGVMLTHRNIGYSVSVSAQARGLHQDDRIYAALPMSHIFGLASVVLSALGAGASVYLTAKFEASHAARALAGGITCFFGVPTMFVRILALSEGGNPVVAPQLRFVLCGGAPMDGALKERVESLFALPVSNGYGMTEASPTICMMPLNQSASDLTVGYLIPGLEARIVDEEDCVVATDAVGELKIRGPSITKGYYRAPELTAEVLSADGWFATGDLVRQTADGRFYVMGRNKDLIIHSGFNVYPAEVEAALNAHPSVAHSCVVGRSVQDDEEVVAYVELHPQEQVSEQELKAFVKAALAPYKRPSRVILTPHLPTTQTGKILKKEVQLLASCL